MIGLAGGLGLFIFGMIYMSDALQKFAGSKLKDWIAALTKKKIYAVLVGIFITILIQSSSATTVMTVGFVNAGILSLNQAIGIIMGANIGTTVVTQLISFNFEMYAPLIIGLSVVAYVLGKNKQQKNIASIFIGFGLLLLGMGLMKETISPLRDSPVFIDLIINLSNPVIGLLVGLVMTALLQSSAATAGILIAIAGSGLLNINMAFPVLLGSNIGTCVTALLSSIGATKTARKAAVIHVTIKVIGAILFMAYLRFPLQSLVETMNPLRVERQIANANTIFNVMTVLMVYPFSDKIVKFSHKLVRGQDKMKKGHLTYVNDDLIFTPDVAIQQMKKEVLALFGLVEKQLNLSKKALMQYDDRICRTVFENEECINQIEGGMFQFIIKLTGQNLNEGQMRQVTTVSKTVTDLERVADLAENQTELAVIMKDNQLKLSDKAAEELTQLYEKATILFETSRQIYKSEDMDLKIEMDQVLDDTHRLLETSQINHLERTRTQQYNTQAEVVFLDALGNLERIGAHAMSIVRTVSRLKF